MKDRAAISLVAYIASIMLIVSIIFKLIPSYTIAFTLCVIVTAFSLAISFMVPPSTFKIPFKAMDIFFSISALLSIILLLSPPTCQCYMENWLSISVISYARLILTFLAVISIGYFLTRIFIGEHLTELCSIIVFSTVTGISASIILTLLSIVATGTLNELIIPFTAAILAAIYITLKKGFGKATVELNPVLSSLFSVFILLLYVSTMEGFIPFYDMWIHYARTMHILLHGTLTLSKTNMFHAFLACLVKLSSFPEVNMFTILNLIGFLPTLAFYTFAKAIKPSSKVANLATILFSLSTSLSWILLLSSIGSENILETISWMNCIIPEDFTKQNLQVFGSYYFSFTYAIMFAALFTMLKEINHRKLFIWLLIVLPSSFIVHPSEPIMLSIIVSTMTLLGWIKEENCKLFHMAFTLSYPAIILFSSLSIPFLALFFLVPIGYSILTLRIHKRLFPLILSLFTKLSIIGIPLALTLLTLLVFSISFFNFLSEPLTQFSTAQLYLKGIPWYSYMIKFGLPVLALAIPVALGKPLNEDVKTIILAVIPLLAIGVSITLLKLMGITIPYWESRVANFFTLPLIALSTSIFLTKTLESTKKTNIGKLTPIFLMALVILASIPTFFSMTYYVHIPKIPFEEAAQARNTLDSIHDLRGNRVIVLSYQADDLLTVTGYGRMQISPSKLQPPVINLLRETPDPIEFYWHLSSNSRYLMLMEGERPELESINSFLAYYVLADENLVKRSSLIEVYRIPWMPLNYSYKTLILSPLESRFKTALLTSLLENGLYYDICPLESLSSVKGYDLVIYTSSPNNIEEAYLPLHLSNQGFNTAILLQEQPTLLLETLDLLDKVHILDATVNFTWKILEGNATISIKDDILFKSIHIKGKTSKRGKLQIEINPANTMKLTNFSTLKTIVQNPMASTKIYLKCTYHNYTFTLEPFDKWVIKEIPITIGYDTIEKIIVDITYPPGEECTLEIAGIYATKQPETVKLRQVKHGDQIIEIEDKDSIEAFKLKGSYEILIDGIDEEGNEIPILVKLPTENGSLYHLNLKISTELNSTKLYKILKLTLSEIASKLGEQKPTGIEHPKLSANSIQCSGTVTIETDAIYIYPARIVQGLHLYETLLKENILNPYMQFKIKIAFNGTARIEPSEEINMVRIIMTPKATITINNYTTITTLENTTIKVKTPTITVKGTLILNEKGEWLKTIMHITRKHMKITGTTTIKISRSAKRIYIKTLNYTGTTATIDPILQPLKENYITAYRIPELLLITITTFTVTLVTEIAILLRKLKKTLKAIAPDYRKE